MKNWDKFYLNIAAEFAAQSTCIKRKVGAILVKDLRIQSTGYNGTPSGTCNCNEVFTQGLDIGVLKKGFKKIKINHHDFAEKFEIHAEQNCLAFAAKSGVRTSGCTMYVTTAPCVHCAKLIIASGIQKVVYMSDYKNSDGLNLLKEAKIDFVKIEHPED